MSMRDGVKRVANTALDVKDDLCMIMIEDGVDPKEALKASSVVAKLELDNIIDKALGNSNAAVITKKLSDIGKDQKFL
jgi:hypothetical protein